MSETLPDPVVAPLPRAIPAAKPSRAGVKIAVAALAAAIIGSAVTLAVRPPSLLPPASVTRTEVAPTPDVVLAIQNLSKLEAVTFHLERVVDLADHQERLFGLVEARDAILLVAVGDVVAGCDLSELKPENVESDFEHHRVKVKLPAPKVFSTALDDKATHVYARKTDTLAARHEDLESRARREAQRSMEQAAIDSGILDRARGSSEGAVRSLLEAVGFTDVTVEFESAR